MNFREEIKGYLYRACSDMCIYSVKNVTAEKKRRDKEPYMIFLLPTDNVSLCGWTLKLVYNISSVSTAHQLRWSAAASPICDLSPASSLCVLILLIHAEVIVLAICQFWSFAIKNRYCWS